MIKLVLKLGVLATAIASVACSSSSSGSYRFAQVLPVAETNAVVSKGDAADDPAIWVNQATPTESRILGTDKQYGLMVYNLAGEEVQSLPQGRLNNVDLRQGVTLNSGLADIAVASNRDTFSIDVFEIATDGQVALIESIPTGLQDIYGICSGLRNNGELVVFANGKSGAYEQWFLNPEGIFNPELEGKFKLDTQPEGCAVDDYAQKLYVGEESTGIWQMDADYRAFDSKVLIDKVAKPYLKADVEGMDIYQSEGERYLVASSQGNNSYAVYDISAAPKHVGSFRIENNKEAGVDGVQETDGLALSAANLGGVFAQGLLVVQDGENKKPKAHQNFKLVSWAELLSALQPN